MLLNLRPNLNPTSVSCDYETAAFESAKARFPGAEIDGCFFHFVKNFKKHVGRNNMMQQYNNDPNFALQARMIPALAFVPIPNLDATFAALSQHLPPIFQPLLQWLETSYLGRRVGRQNWRRPSLFPVPMWNVHNRVINHRRVQLELKTDHPTIWKLITDLKTVQKGGDTFY